MVPEVSLIFGDDGQSGILQNTGPRKYPINPGRPQGVNNIRDFVPPRPLSKLPSHSNVPAMLQQQQVGQDQRRAQEHVHERKPSHSQSAPDLNQLQYQNNGYRNMNGNALSYSQPASAFNGNNEHEFVPDVRQSCPSYTSRNIHGDNNINTRSMPQQGNPQSLPQPRVAMDPNRGAFVPVSQQMYAAAMQHHAGPQPMMRASRPDDELMHQINPNQPNFPGHNMQGMRQVIRPVPQGIQRPQCAPLSQTQHGRMPRHIAAPPQFQYQSQQQAVQLQPPSTQPMSQPNLVPYPQPYDNNPGLMANHFIPNQRQYVPQVQQQQMNVPHSHAMDTVPVSNVTAIAYSTQNNQSLQTTNNQSQSPRHIQSHQSVNSQSQGTGLTVHPTSSHVAEQPPSTLHGLPQGLSSIREGTPPFPPDQKHNITQGDSSKSSDDSGLSFTPEKSTAPGTKGATGSPSLEVQKDSNMVIGASDINWNQVPKEVYQLLIQQNEQLQKLQSQIQTLMNNQSASTQCTTMTDLPSSSNNTCDCHSKSHSCATSADSEHTHSSSGKVDMAMNTSLTPATESRVLQNVALQTSPQKQTNLNYSNGHLLTDRSSGSSASHSSSERSRHSNDPHTPAEIRHRGRIMMNSTEREDLDIDVSEENLSCVVDNMALHNKTVDSVQSDIILDLPSYHSSPTR